LEAKIHLLIFFGNDDIFGSRFGGDGFGQFSSSFSSFSNMGPGVTSTSTSVRVVNGEKVTTTTTVQGGVKTETVVKEKNGKVVSKSINGVPQDIKKLTQ